MSGRCFSLVLLLALAQFVSAQVSVSGTVTSKDDGQPLPGVSVLIEGTQVGTTTDFDGKYVIEAKSGSVLVFTFIGMVQQKVTVGGTVGALLVIDVQMEADTQVLDDVVVTALGIKRSQKSLGYAQVEVKGEDLTVAKQTDVVAAMAGKVPGVQILGAPGSSFRNAEVRIRGVNSLKGGKAIFVVDGTIVQSSDDVDMDNVATLSVLKGPAATALYGTRGANGVIVITTKAPQQRGPADAGWGVSVHYNLTIDQVALLPDYQNEYAGGYSQTNKYYVDADGNTWNEGTSTGKKYEVLDMAADESWGPKIDGRKYRPWYTWHKEHEDYGKEKELKAHPDNVKDFFDLGITSNTNVALSKAGDGYSARVSYTNVVQTGIVPNSESHKNYLSTNLEYDLSEHLQTNVSFTYKKNKVSGRPAEGYSPSGRQNVMQAFNQWFQRQLDIKQTKVYENKDGSLRTWNPKSANDLSVKYWNSPYYDLYENVPTDDDTSLYGSASLTYKYNENFKITGNARLKHAQSEWKRRVATGGRRTDYSRTAQLLRREQNYDFLAVYEDKFMNDDITLVSNFGGNVRLQTYDYFSVSTNGGLTVPNLFNIRASKDRPSAADNYYQRQINSLYGVANIGYKDYIFVDFSLRNDWASVLPEDNNSYLYPSVNTSFVFSELLADDIKQVISFGKLRAAWGMVGEDIEPYKTQPVYSVRDTYSGSLSLRMPENMPNEDLKPALSSSMEFGTDLKFFNNRLGLDFTYFRNDNEDQIIDLSVPASSGYDETVVNAGNIRTWGIEIGMYAQPIKMEDFSWEVNVSFAKTKTTIEELSKGQEKIRLSRGYWGTALLYATKGKEWGEIIGKKFQRKDGKIVMNSDGTPKTKDEQHLGQILPDFTGGVVNTFTWKDFVLSAAIDFQQGGMFYSITNMWMDYSGVSAITAKDDIREHGIVIDGVTEDGEVNTKRLSAKDYFKALDQIGEHAVFDASYVKFRELSLGYNFPKSITEMMSIKGASFSFVLRNVGLLYSATPNIDPSEIEKDWGGTDGFPAWSEGGQNPGVRSYGFSVKFNF